MSSFVLICRKRSSNVIDDDDDDDIINDDDIIIQTTRDLSKLIVVACRALRFALSHLNFAEVLLLVLEWVQRNGRSASGLRSVSSSHPSKSESP